MGQVPSTVTSSLENIVPVKNRNAVKRELSLFRERARFYSQLALLTQNEFLDAVEELNSILKMPCHHSQSRIGFVSSFRSNHFGWKTGTRVYCFMINNNDESIMVTRSLNTLQFWILRNEILRQVERKTENEKFGEFQFVHDDIVVGESNQNMAAEDEHTTHSNTQLCSLSTSAVFERIETISSEELECCICMSRKSNVSLSCAHCFCKECIESWSASRDAEQQTCPICRQRINSTDEIWEMTEAPDSEEMKEHVRNLATGIVADVQ